MGDSSATNSGHRRQSSRLQRRAPASIKISREPDWNVAIPLLSPLISSPSSPNSSDLTALMKSSNNNRSQVAETEKKPPPPPPVVFKKWQHPAAPFCYEPAAPLVPFVCTGGVDRS